MNGTTIALAAAAMALAAALAILAGLAGRGGRGYRREEALLTRTEAAFFSALLKAASGGGWYVCPKVRLGDVVTVPGRHDKAWRARYAKVAQKHLDFVLCERRGMRPALGIELDDRSHLRADAARRDREKDAACRQAGFPLMRYPARGAYDPADIRRALREALQGADGM